jgi:hypothetical protein
VIAADVDALLKRLQLANARRVWRDLCARADGVAHRQEATRDAGFPFHPKPSRCTARVRYW